MELFSEALGISRLRVKIVRVCDMQFQGEIHNNAAQLTHREKYGNLTALQLLTCLELFLGISFLMSVHYLFFLFMSQ